MGMLLFRNGRCENGPSPYIFAPTPTGFKTNECAEVEENVALVAGFYPLDRRFICVGVWPVARLTARENADRES